MAASGAVTLDKVQIEIESSTSKASKNIDTLAESLTKLKNAVKGGFKQVSNLAEYLNELQSVSKKLPNITNNLSSLSGIAKAIRPLTKIGSTKGLNDAVENIKKIPDALGSITPDTLENVTRVAGELSKALKPLANEMRDISNGYKSISQLANRYNISVRGLQDAHKSASRSNKTLLNGFKGTGSFLKGFGKVIVNTFSKGYKTIDLLEKPLKNITSKAKQAGFALLSVRSAFTFLRKAIDEYLNLDTELQDSIQNTWRGMGAQLAPAVEYMSYLFHQFVRVIYSVILALTGIDLISRANQKAMAGWGKSAKDTLGNLQKFDDLNVVEFPSSSSDTGDNELIDLQTIDLTPIQKIIDWVKEMRDTIKEALDTGQWETVGTVFGKGINGALDTFVSNLPKIREKLYDIANSFADFMNGAIDEIHWDNIGKSIASISVTVRNIASEFLEGIEWESVGKGLNDLILNIPYEDILNSFIRLWVNVGQAFTKVLSEIDFEELGRKVRTAIENIDWKQVWNTVVDLFKEAFGGLNDFIKGLSNGWADIIKVAIVTIAVAGVIKAIKEKISSIGISKTTAGTGTSGDISGGLSNLVGDLGKATETIAILGGLALVLNQIVDLVRALGETGMNANEMFGSMMAIMAPLIVLITSLTLASQLLQSPTAMAGFAVLVAGIVLTLITMSETIPIILDALGTFIDKTAPPLILLLDTINKGIANIIYAIGTTLPPIIDSIGNTFERIFNGIANIIRTVGDVIVDIMTTAKNLIVDVLQAQLNFINELGPAINNFVDNAIIAVTKLINFIVSGIEWLINTFIIDSINGLLRQVKENKIAELLGVDGKISYLQPIYINRFVPQLETGTNEIPMEGLYHLHPGEAVVPKKYNPAINNDNDAVNEKLDTLISVMENLEFVNVVNLGNKTLYKEQRKYNKQQNNKYGTIEL